MCMEEKRLTITMDCWDKYKDARSLFFCSLKRNWENRKYPLIIACNSDISDEDIPGRLIVCANDSTDSKRHLEAVKAAETKYVLLIVEDGVFTKKVNQDRIEAILDFMDKNNMDFCKLYPTPDKSGKTIKGFENAKYINKRQPYGINYLCGIYRKTYLENLLNNHYKDSWEIEEALLRQAANASKGYYTDKMVVTDDPLSVRFCIEKGKWSFWARRFIKKNGYHLDSNRETWSFRHEAMAKIKHLFSRFVPARFRHNLKHISQKFGMKYATKE